MGSHRYHHHLHHQQNQQQQHLPNWSEPRGYSRADFINAVIQGNEQSSFRAALGAGLLNEPRTVHGESNRPPAVRINTNNIIVQSNYNGLPPTSVAPKIISREPTTRHQDESSTTARHLPQQYDSPKSPPLRRSNAIRVKRSDTTVPEVGREVLPEHLKATPIDSMNRLSKESPRPSSLYNSKKRAQTMMTMSPVKNVVRGLAGLGKMVFSRTATEPVRSQSIQTPRLTLMANHKGQVPLLTLEYKRYVDFKDPLHSEPLLRAWKTLQVFRAAFTRNLPEHRFPRGQAQVDIVARYIMTPCSTSLEDSRTTQLVRHSAISLRAWQAYTRPDDYPPLSRDSKPHQRWNMIEARRRVRKHNRVIAEFNAEWDAWVAAQNSDIQISARRKPESDEIQEGTQSPFRDFYHWMLVACDEEIKQRQDIGEALVLQYPSSFPGFMKESAESG